MPNKYALVLLSAMQGKPMYQGTARTDHRKAKSRRKMQQASRRANR